MNQISEAKATRRVFFSFSFSFPVFIRGAFLGFRGFRTLSFYFLFSFSSFLPCPISLFLTQRDRVGFERWWKRQKISAPPPPFFLSFFPSLFSFSSIVLGKREGKMLPANPLSFITFACFPFPLLFLFFPLSFLPPSSLVFFLY